MPGFKFELGQMVEARRKGKLGLVGRITSRQYTEHLDDETHVAYHLDKANPLFWYLEEDIHPVSGKLLTLMPRSKDEDAVANDRGYKDGKYVPEKAPDA